MSEYICTWREIHLTKWACDLWPSLYSIVTSDHAMAPHLWYDVMHNICLDQFSLNNNRYPIITHCGIQLHHNMHRNYIIRPRPITGILNGILYGWEIVFFYFKKKMYVNNILNSSRSVSNKISQIRDTSIESDKIERHASLLDDRKTVFIWPWIWPWHMLNMLNMLYICHVLFGMNVQLSISCIKQCYFQRAPWVYWRRKFL